MPHKTNGRFPWEREKKLKAAAYDRDLDATRFLPYEEKSPGLLRMLVEATKREFEIVIVARPEILGDDYEKLVAKALIDEGCSTAKARARGMPTRAYASHRRPKDSLPTDLHDRHLPRHNQSPQQVFEGLGGNAEDPEKSVT